MPVPIPEPKTSTGFATTAPEFKQQPKKKSAVGNDSPVANKSKQSTRIISWLQDNWVLIAGAGLIIWLIWG